MQNETIKKSLKRVDLEIFDRIIQSLYEGISLKRTSLSRNAGLSYDHCVLYLDFLENLDFVKKENDSEDHYVFSLTVQGINYCKKTLNKEFSNTKFHEKNFLA